MSTIRSGLLALALGACLLLPPAAAEAHPHAWIDLDSRLIFDDAGKLEAIELHWLFDELYTAFIAEEFTTAGIAPSAFLEEVAAENLARLRAYDFFTDLEQNDEALALGDVRRFATGLEGERLWLEFEIPLATAADPADGPFAFAVYDPTYYVEVLYHPGHSPTLDGIPAGDCKTFVMPPTPTAAHVAMAFALDMNQSGEKGLGRHFAEIATIECR